MPGIFYTKEGIPLEIEFNAAENPRSCLVVWPCMGGSFRMYRVPLESFNRLGISVLLYNPRGHGESSGQATADQLIDDLEYCVNKNGLNEIPLVITGHSAGANLALKFGSRMNLIERFFLVAPVLDSCESLRYMYRRGTIHEFTSIIAQLAVDPAPVRAVLENEQWLDPVYWENEKIRQRLDNASGKFLVGTFLEKLFLPTHNAYDDLGRHGKKTTIILSTEDNWYPRQRVDGLCEKHGIRRQMIPAAGDHFFTGAWKDVWNFILAELAGRAD